eukprot:CAMPEP_0203664454 /NCGR_PEP_ID=MMETSP0090-20130426/1862_1 /ASSEMBLY_ACC=CAM_ASM_001088 /TAXON_ID=426623 /ORGANISM="Chaetoceros affinis, Strain CCMP159" /LENGTH=412 /DNA_ID=CAMNT_0050527703 /DNA_START=80 /DNA_END=1315 /DNA_ORIENTATION=+
MKDMNNFKHSPAKRDLLSFVTTLGRSTFTASTSTSSSSSSSYIYNRSNPLVGLSPGMASLHGSLNAIATNWLREIPPDASARARFGNPKFKEWHERLVRRSRSIIECMMDCHVKYVVVPASEDEDGGLNGGVELWDMEVLEKCSLAGQRAAMECEDDNSGGDTTTTTTTTTTQQEKVIVELQAYLHQAFGHQIRLDYGTGHECSFYIFLYSLCKIGLFGNIPKTKTPSADIMAPVALSITFQYLQICRGIQTEYMLEPAGSHGVWGLDDYHCVPFYIGACQIQNVFYKDASGGCFDRPSCIHDDSVLIHSEESDSMLYFTCIRYIKSLKKGVPFFESSPMLNDIGQLSNWAKVSGGLLRLFEGEVLDKKPVVQHFVFGDIFKASWNPSESEREAPSITFKHDPHQIDSVAPW